MGSMVSKLAVGGAGLLLAVGLAEVLVRLLGLAPAPPDPMDPFLELHALHADPEIGYTLRPGAVGEYQNAKVRVNALGCRDDAVLDGPPLRILALGDSITFGASIDQADTWEARLDQALGEVDVMNCGVSGYNLLQAQARYDEALAELSPDIVLLNVFSDDLAPPYRMAERGLRPWLRQRSAAFRVAELGWIALFGASGRRLPDWADDEASYRDGAAERATTWVEDQVRAGRRVLVIVHPMLIPVGHNWQATRAEIREFAESLGQPALFLEPLYADATAGQLQMLSINPASQDPHPNLDGQELIALALWRRLHELGWVSVEPGEEAPPRRGFVRATDRVEQR